MTNKNKFLLDTERLKKLEPIMRECGVSPSAWLHTEDGKTYELRKEKTVVRIQDSNLRWHVSKDLTEASNIPTFDHADIESIFTHKTWDTITYLAWAIEDKHIKRIFEREPVWEKIFAQAVSLYKSMAKTRRQEKLEFMTDLIILVHENNIPLGVQTDD